MFVRHVFQNFGCPALFSSQLRTHTIHFVKILVHYFQFSTRRPGIRSKCLTLSVTKIRSLCKAVAPMSKSILSIILPSRSNCQRTSPYSFMHEVMEYWSKSDSIVCTSSKCFARPDLYAPKYNSPIVKLEITQASSPTRRICSITVGLHFINSMQMHVSSKYFSCFIILTTFLLCGYSHAHDAILRQSQKHFCPHPNLYETFQVPYPTWMILPWEQAPTICWPATHGQLMEVPFHLCKTTDCSFLMLS